jgi:hypothetical protein
VRRSAAGAVAVGTAEVARSGVAAFSDAARDVGSGGSRPAGDGAPEAVAATPSPGFGGAGVVVEKRRYASQPPPAPINNAGMIHRRRRRFDSSAMGASVPDVTRA